MPARVVPVFQIYGFRDFAFKDPEIDGRQSDTLEKLQILKSVKPRLNTSNPQSSTRQPQGRYLIYLNLRFSVYEQVSM